MSKEIVIATSPHETKVAVLEDSQVVEVYIEREREYGLVGSVYKGKVTRVLPGMQSAFVDIGLDRDAFLYVSDFVEELEEYERISPLSDLSPLEGPESEPTAPEREETAPPAASEAPREPAPAPAAGPTGKSEPEPSFARSEPPLNLPERRPLGRRRRRGNRRRHRGGRGRRGPFHGRSRHGDLGPPGHHRGFPRDLPADEPYEPIVLPGESLAKYRDRSPNRGPQAESADSRKEPEPRKENQSAPETNESNPFEHTSNGPLHPDQASGREERTESSDRNQPREAAGSESESAAPGAGKEPVTPSEGGEEPAISAEKEQAAIEPNAPSEPSPRAYPEAENGAESVLELESRRVRPYEDQIGLPPSVQDRTAGGVEWSREPRGRGRGRGRGRRHRGGRHRRREALELRRRRRTSSRPSGGQPPIAELLHPGQEVIVQIAKEQMGKKGARVTSHVTLPGRYLVYMPTIEHIGVSRKIATSQERARLRNLLLRLKGTFTGGFVIRTAAAGCSEEELMRDVGYLANLWQHIRTGAEKQPPPCLLHRDLSLVERILRDHLTPDYDAIWIDNEEEYAGLVEFVARFQPQLTSRVKLYTKPAPIFEELGVQQEIDHALRPKVWLKSGGYIVINHTEALVAIDVNTGKFVGKGSTRLEDTIVKTNLDAVKEIVRQIRLRDLGGIIVIDFIDMEDRRNRQRVMAALEEALRADKSPSKILSFNEFGLVAITRKRSRQSLERILCQPCPYCTGTGMVKSMATLCYEIQGEARKMAATIDAPELTIRAHPDVVKALKGRDDSLVRELEEQTGKNIMFQSDNTLHYEQYNIY